MEMDDSSAESPLDGHLEGKQKNAQPVERRQSPDVTNLNAATAHGNIKQFLVWVSILREDQNFHGYHLSGGVAGGRAIPKRRLPSLDVCRRRAAVFDEIIPKVLQIPGSQSNPS